ncbi:farnesol dehydrogenase-like [Uranotaenia lowii]|uniref:farnesol dehydrogenase-like n=1 Tax=Uranotaenia lowii TaxID=190385 RepID=UPI00247898DA|nr:farnesol dehydrogenase-like [Uranotaenia lowii]
MDRWVGKIAVVTGASSGIGAATAKELAKAGMIVVGMARRVQLIEALKADLPAEAAARLHAIRCDVTKESDILAAFEIISTKFGGIDVMVNNAGVSELPINLGEGNSESLARIYKTNVFGLLVGSREAYQSMKARGVDGHIIHMGSLLGRRVPDIPESSLYSPTKFAVRAITEAMQLELRKENSKIRVTCVSPSAVLTAITQEFAGFEPILEPIDIAQAVIHALKCPPNVRVQEVVVRATQDVLNS